MAIVRSVVFWGHLSSYLEPALILGVIVIALNEIIDFRYVFLLFKCVQEGRRLLVLSLRRNAVEGGTVIFIPTTWVAIALLCILAAEHEILGRVEVWTSNTWRFASLWGFVHKILRELVAIDTRLIQQVLVWLEWLGGLLVLAIEVCESVRWPALIEVLVIRRRNVFGSFKGVVGLGIAVETPLRILHWVTVSILVVQGLTVGLLRMLVVIGAVLRWIEIRSELPMLLIPHPVVEQRLGLSY